MTSAPPAAPPSMSAISVPPRWFSAVRAVVCVFGLLLAASQAWLTRNNMAADGISYLDMGSAFATGNASALVNGYWSPLYPVAIGIGLAVVRPLPQNEFAVVHAVNFAIFLFAFACFGFLLRTIVTACSKSEGGPPAWFLEITGYVIFFWATLGLTTVSVTSPDMLMATFVFLATGFLVRIATKSVPRQTLFVGLGLALGFGYLAKVPMFLLSFVYLAIAAAIVGRFRMPMRNVALSAFAFVIVSAPLIFFLSKDKHRLTFGDSGRLNYAWYVDGATYRHWQGEPLGEHSEVAPQWTSGAVSTGVPVHPTRRVIESPAIFEFARAGTYPVWYDPSYWNEGLVAPFDAKQQLRKIITNAKFYYAELLNPHVVQLYREGHAFQFFSPLLILSMAALVIVGARLRPSGIWQIAVPVVLPAVAAFGMYLLVYSEPRHLGAFVVILYTGILATMRIPSKVTLSGIAAVIVLAYAATVGIESAPSIFTAAHSMSGSDAMPTEEWQVVEGLRQMGFGEGLRVGALNYSNHDHVRWARMARATIVAEVFPGAYRPSEDEFWYADAQKRSFVIDALVQSGAQVIVSRRLPASINPPEGWKRIGSTRYYALVLRHA